MNGLGIPVDRQTDRPHNLWSTLVSSSPHGMAHGRQPTAPTHKHKHKHKHGAPNSVCYWSKSDVSFWSSLLVALPYCNACKLHQHNPDNVHGMWNSWSIKFAARKKGCGEMAASPGLACLTTFKMPNVVLAHGPALQPKQTWAGDDLGGLMQYSTA